MRMYLYDMTEPMRDGCLAVGTVIHEYGGAKRPGRGS